jgi:hypothetical protein
MKKLALFLIFFLAITVTNNVFSAPPGPPPSSAGKPPCWPPPCIPIDGGVSFLIAAGVAYGAKKIYDNKKKSDLI